MEDSVSRFSRTVEYYIKYRPGYPQAIVDLLRAECHLANGAVVADVGAGTGLLAGLFIKNGYRASALKGGVVDWLTANYPVETKEALRSAPPEPGSLK